MADSEDYPATGSPELKGHCERHGITNVKNLTIATAQQMWVHIDGHADWPINVIASQRVGAKRRPMTGSAKIPWGVDSDQV